jgi:hypothetical protein
MRRHHAMQHPLLSIVPDDIRRFDALQAPSLLQAFLCSAQVTANWAVLNIFGKDKASPIEDLTPFYYTDARSDWHQQLVIVARNNRETPCLPPSSY